MRRNRGVNTFSGSGGGRRFPGGGPIQGDGDGGGGGPISRGTLPPGLITDDALNGAALSTKHIRFHRQGFAFDNTLYSVGAHDNTGWSRTGGVTDSLLLQLGAFEDYVVAYVWGSFAWANNAASAYTGRVCLVLYQGTDTDADGVSDSFATYQRSVNTVLNRLPADGTARLFSIFSQFVIPATEGVDWWVGMQHQVASGSNPLSGTQDQREQTLMAYTCAFDPELDSNLVAGTLE